MHHRAQAGRTLSDASTASRAAATSSLRRATSSTTDMTNAASVKLPSFHSRLLRAPVKPV